MNPAPNLVLIGPTGAGKSSLGRRVAERFSLSFVDLDHAIAERAGASIADIFEHAGEAGFRQRESATLADVLGSGGRLVSTGAGAILDAGNRALMRQQGFIVHLKVSVEAQLRRLGRCANRPLLQQPDREQVLREMARIRDPLYAEIADLTFNTDGLPPAEATARLIQLLAHRWQRNESFA